MYILIRLTTAKLALPWSTITLNFFETRWLLWLLKMGFTRSWRDFGKCLKYAVSCWRVEPMIFWRVSLPAVCKTQKRDWNYDHGIKRKIKEHSEVRPERPLARNLVLWPGWETQHPKQMRSKHAATGSH